MKRNQILSRLAAALTALCMLVTPAWALTVEQARELLEKNYVDVIDQEVLDKPTIDELLSALGDPYTEYLGPQEYAALLSSMGDETLCGIGATSAKSEEGLLIDGVIEGSPAQAAGLEPGDVMVAVDGVSIVDMELDQAVELIRGEEGTKVEITYLRQGRGQRRRVTLTRAVIVLPATTGQALEGGVGYINCDTWGEDTLGHFRELIDEMEPQVGCWLIDLRDNVGGLTAAAAQTAGLFCGEGVMLSLRLRSDDPASPDGYAYEPFVSLGEAITHKPVVLLINGNTASASESFVAALRDHGVAVSVGERTFGKGVAQGLWDKTMEPELFADGDCMKITVARFYSPLGNTNDTLGVIPDLLVDEPYILEVGWLLCEEFDPSATQNTFSFLWEDSGEGFTISLDHLAQNREDWAGAYTALIDALPSGLPLFHNDDVTVRRDLAQTLALPLAEPDFPDWTDAQFYNELGVLKAYGLVHGDEKGLFHPQDGLTRAQFCQMLYNLLPAQPPENVSPFDDVSPDAWYADAVLAMWSRGLVSGTGEGKFSPDQPMDLQQMFTIMGRLTRWINYQVDEDAAFQEALGEWPDDLAAYDGWAKPSVWTLCRGITGMDDLPIPLLWDDPEDLTPTDPATRDQAAFLLENLLYTLDLLP